MAGLDALAALGHPVVLGASRKSFLAAAAGCPDIAERDAPTVALTALGRTLGARIFRVHAVQANTAALRVTESLLRVRAG